MSPVTPHIRFAGDDTLDLPLHEDESDGGCRRGSALSRREWRFDAARDSLGSYSPGTVSIKCFIGFTRKEMNLVTDLPPGSSSYATSK